MKKLALTTALALGIAGAAMAQDAVEGIWQTAADDNGNYGHIEVVPCGNAFCGTLIKSFDSSGNAMASENVGKRIIWDMQSRGSGKYARGKIWSPDRDKTYNSKMTLSGDTIAVKGCVLGICRDGGTWTRVN